jgi:hypothetical protein
MNVLPGIASLRNLSAATGLAVPLLVTLAAISLDRLFQYAGPRLSLSSGARTFFSLPAWRVVLAAACLLGLNQVYQFSKGYLYVRPLNDYTEEITLLKTPSAQWIKPPFGHYDWTYQLLSAGLRIGDTWRPWKWAGRENPVPLLEVQFAGQEQNQAQPLYASTASFAMTQNPLGEYAVLKAGSRQTPCQAHALGGRIDVRCDAPEAGTLTLAENRWQGWVAYVDGVRWPLLGGTRLAVQFPAGKHAVAFRYMPWDVPLGLALSLAGMVACVIAARKLRHSPALKVESSVEILK